MDVKLSLLMVIVAGGVVSWALWLIAMTSLNINKGRELLNKKQRSKHDNLNAKKVLEKETPAEQEDLPEKEKTAEESSITTASWLSSK